MGFGKFEVHAMLDRVVSGADEPQFSLMARFGPGAVKCDSSFNL